MLYGNLTRDPELKALPSGASVCSMSIATNRVFKDRDGKQQEQVEYHNIVIYGKQAESTAKWLAKGAGVFIEGRLQTRSWDKDGVKQYRTEVIADRVQFGPKKQGSTGTKEKTAQDTVDDMYDGKGGALEYPEDEINPEDIPF